jgi:hypothetical protein
MTRTIGGCRDLLGRLTRSRQQKFRPGFDERVTFAPHFSGEQMRASILGLVILTACGPTPTRPDGTDVDAPQPTPDSTVQPPGDGTSVGCQAIDVLFVIDNSGSMGEEQTNLTANFPGFITVLDQSGLDYRVAVTTTGRDYNYAMTFPVGGAIPMSQDGGDNGTMLKTAAMTRRWIEKTDPDVAGTFTAVATVGTGGPSDEMPLSAMRDAFEERMSDGTNAGFHRPEALLAIVFLTDEEDCSYEQSVTLGFSQSLCDAQMEPVQNYVTFLDQYTGNRSRWAAAAIAGKGPGTCTSTFGNADEATRLVQFVQQTGANATMSSICDGDLSIGLAQALEVFESACGGILL